MLIRLLLEVKTRKQLQKKVALLLLVHLKVALLN
jgi:hypothetical protein